MLAFSTQILLTAIAEGGELELCENLKQDGILSVAFYTTFVDNVVLIGGGH